jgi:hypothetical protein
MTLEDLDDMIRHAKPGHEILVPSTDPDGGPYTKPIEVAEADVKLKCLLRYRTITGHEHDDMIGEVALGLIR